MFSKISHSNVRVQVSFLCLKLSSSSSHLMYFLAMFFWKVSYRMSSSSTSFFTILSSFIHVSIPYHSEHCLVTSLCKTGHLGSFELKLQSAMVATVVTTENQLVCQHSVFNVFYYFLKVCLCI